MAKYHVYEVKPRLMNNRHDNPLPFSATLVEKSVESTIMIKGQNTIVPSNSKLELVNEEGRMGSFESFIISTDKPSLEVHIELYGHNKTVHTVPYFSANRLLKFGLGLSVGEVQENPDGSYPDISGKPNPILPYLLRYKPQTTIPNMLGETDPVFVMAYTPSPPHTFTEGVRVWLENNWHSDALIYEMLGMIHFIVEPNESLNSV